MPDPGNSELSAKFLAENRKLSSLSCVWCVLHVSCSHNILMIMLISFSVFLHFFMGFQKKLQYGHPLIFKALFPLLF